MPIYLSICLSIYLSIYAYKFTALFVVRSAREVAKFFSGGMDIHLQCIGNDHVKKSAFCASM